MPRPQPRPSQIASRVPGLGPSFAKVVKRGGNGSTPSGISSKKAVLLGSQPVARGPFHDSPVHAASLGSHPTHSRDSAGHSSQNPYPHSVGPPGISPSVVPGPLPPQMDYVGVVEDLASSHVAALPAGSLPSGSRIELSRRGVVPLLRTMLPLCLMVFPRTVAVWVPLLWCRIVLSENRG
ncbi:hypothetical protein Ancab_029847 [Ancistrocladus abbreviatus]